MVKRRSFILSVCNALLCILESSRNASDRLVLLFSFKIDVDGPTTASKLLRRAFTGGEIRIAATLRVLAADMIEQRLECVGDFLEFSLREVFPLVEMHRLVDRPQLGAALLNQCFGLGEFCLQRRFGIAMPPMFCRLDAFFSRSFHRLSVGGSKSPRS